MTAVLERFAGRLEDIFQDVQAAPYTEYEGALAAANEALKTCVIATFDMATGEDEAAFEHHVCITELMWSHRDRLVRGIAARAAPGGPE